METKSQQNFYNKAVIVLFLQNFLFGAYTSGSGAKSHEMAHNNPLLPVYVVYSLYMVE